MAQQLSTGALLSICQGGDVDKPVFQILNIKKMAGAANGRYRMLISDGKYSNSYAMLASQSSDQIQSNEVTEFSIVRVAQYIVNKVQSKKIIVLLSLEVLKPGSAVGHKIGEPIPINIDGTVSENLGSSHNSGSGNDCQQPSKRSVENETTPPPAKKPLHSTGNIRCSGLLDPSPVVRDTSRSVMPIQALTPYNNKWTIRARVTKKSDIKRWSNSRGDGYLFNMDLVDESGEIRATAFKEQCDKFYDMVEVGKVYYISNCSMKVANKQFCSLNNEYELSFRDSTEMDLCSDDTGDVPSITFNFVRIADLRPELKDSNVDVLGVCKSASDVVTLTSSKTSKEYRKRDITLVDNSLAEIQCTLWGSIAETFDAANHPVLAIKGCKVSDYNGVSLSVLSSSVVQINPDVEKAFQLKGWYETDGCKAELTSMTQSGGGAGGGGGAATGGASFKSIAEARIENLGANMDRNEYYSTMAWVTFLKKENALYQGCANESDGRSCNKKVLNLNNGMYRCEKCNLELDRFNWRLILTVSLADATDQVWAQCFQESAEIILGMSAQDLGELYMNDKDTYDNVFQKAHLKRYSFRLRCRSEHYNDQSRVRHTIQTVAPFNSQENNRRILKELMEAGVSLPASFNKAKYL